MDNLTPQQEYNEWYCNFKNECREHGISRVGEYEDLRSNMLMVEVFANYKGNVLHYRQSITNVHIESAKDFYELKKFFLLKCLYKMKDEIDRLKGNSRGESNVTEKD